MAQVRTMVTFSGLDSATHAWNLLADQGGGAEVFARGKSTGNHGFMWFYYVFNWGKWVQWLFFCWFIWFLIGVIQHRPGLRLGRVEKKTLAGSNMGWAGILEFDPFSEGTFGFIFWAPPFVVWSRSISLWVKAVRSWPTKSSAARRRCSTACRPGTWWILGFGWVVGNGRCLKIWFRRTDLMWPKNKSFNTSEVKNPWRFSFFSLSSVFFMFYQCSPPFLTNTFDHPLPQALRQLWELGGEDKFYYKLVAPLLGRKEWGCWLVCDTWPV